MGKCVPPLNRALPSSKPRSWCQIPTCNIGHNLLNPGAVRCPPLRLQRRILAELFWGMVTVPVPFCWKKVWSKQDLTASHVYQQISTTHHVNSGWSHPKELVEDHSTSATTGMSAVSLATRKLGTLVFFGLNGSIGLNDPGTAIFVSANASLLLASM